MIVYMGKFLMNAKKNLLKVFSNSTVVFLLRLFTFKFPEKVLREYAFFF